MNKNAIIILGNGFDLSLNLESSYNHFFSRLTNYEDMNKYGIWPSIFNFYNKNNNNTYWKDIEQGIKYFLTSSHDYGIHLNNVLNTSILNHIDRNNSGYFSESNEYSFLISKISKKLGLIDALKSFSSSNFKEDYKDFNLEKTHENILENLKLLEDEFNKYIINQRNNVNYYERSKYRLKEIINLNDTNLLDELKSLFILNFNYTKILYPPRSSQFYFPNISIQEQNIHGELTDYGLKRNIIFGIDSEEISMKKNKYIYPFTKTYRVIDNNIRGHLQKNIRMNNNPDYIYFYGHSLGEQDYSYFQSIFDYINLYDSSTILIFVYSDYFNKDNPKLEKQLMTDRVVTLLEKYGESFKQESLRGKNLLHKLLVENRLEIIKMNFS